MPVWSGDRISRKDLSQTKEKTMRIRKTWLVLTLGLLAALFAVQAQAQNNEIEGDVGYYFPGDITLPNARLNYQAGVSYGARYGHRITPLFGGDISWSHFEADNNRSEADRLQCSKCDLTPDGRAASQGAAVARFLSPLRPPSLEIVCPRASSINGYAVWGLCFYGNQA